VHTAGVALVCSLSRGAKRRGRGAERAWAREAVGAANADYAAPPC